MTSTPFFDQVVEELEHDPLAPTARTRPHRRTVRPPREAPLPGSTPGRGLNFPLKIVDATPEAAAMGGSGRG